MNQLVKKQKKIKAMKFQLVFMAITALAISPTHLNANEYTVNSYDFVENQQENMIGVVINEIHYDPDIKTELVEFIELYNPGTSYINLSGWYLNGGISYQFPSGAILPAYGYIIVVQNPAQIQAKWRNIANNKIFGPFEGRLANDGEKIELFNTNNEEIDQVDYQLGFPWPTTGYAIPANNPGSGSSIQLVNSSIDNDLGGSWRSASPTPAARNVSVDINNTPPHIRQVKHTPKEPASGELVNITAKVTDSDGVARVVLYYQFVEPGNYININDHEYRLNWNTVNMQDNGLGGDEQADDDIYTVQLPGSFQVHRRLVRYRIEIRDTIGNSLTVPYSDDLQPNFAYFVYDGVPAWTGAVRPGYSGQLGQAVEYGRDVMNSVPVYHLISKKSDVEACTWIERYGGSDYKWYGTMVYDGEVYDHISYRARGGVWRYAMGKNMWKFNFNRGHRFQAQDDYGKKYKTKWDKLNLSACIQQGDYLHRGEQGMFEAASFKLFNLMGVEAPNTNWMQFRIIDEAGEFGSTQYDGDFWGLYMTLEQMDGRFLDEHNLPDGNLYKIEGFDGKLNNQGPTAVINKSDLNSFMSSSNMNEQWWRQNVNLDSYYSYRCVVEGIHHGDIGYGKNYFFYFYPETDICSMLPWDVDLTWAENMYGNGEDPFKSQAAIFSLPELLVEYQNRLREFQDLLYNPEQMNMILGDLAAVIDDPNGGLSIVDADRAMWDYNPIMNSGYVNSSKAGQGRFYQQADTKDFEGMVQIMKDYVVYVTNNNRNWYGRSGSSMNTLAADSRIPNNPTITYAGSEGYPIDDLTFRTSSFSGPQGSGSFAALKWRIAEVDPNSQFTPTTPQQQEEILLISEQSEWKYFKGTQEPSMRRGQWREINFNDSGWLTGDTPIGYGETFIATNLDDMRGGYSTIYLRKRFYVTDIETIEKLNLDVMYDDGVNIWINGHYVAGDNVYSNEESYDATTANRSEDHTFSRFILSQPDEYLLEGTNVIAVQVINQSLGDSSDCFIDLRLAGEAPLADTPGTTESVNASSRKYEIDTLWQTDEITSFNSTIQIPANAVKIGRTYRVRCRMKDNTNRWSHWSDPIQFTTAEPLSNNIVSDLRITEIMYHPQETNNPNDPNEEYIELKNIGTQILNLGMVCLTNGVDFTFPDIDLGAGEYVLVVKDLAAFTAQYDDDLYIAGEYSGKLANGGERIKLEDPFGQTILDFEYRDDWYIITDGEGFSLTISDPANPDPNSWSRQECWRTSAFVGGSPGWDDTADMN